MIFSWLKRRRRKRILASEFPADWLAHLNHNVFQYRLLTPPEQARLRQRVQVFVAEKLWLGCGGLVVDEEMKVTIAAQACLLVLGIDYEYHYDQIRSVLIYPDTYLHPPGDQDGMAHNGYPVYGGYGYGTGYGVYDYFPTWGVSSIGGWGLGSLASTWLC